MNRSIIDSIIPVVALALAASGTIARTGATIDLTLTESPTDALSFLCASNGGTALFSLEHSDDGSAWAVAPANFVVTGVDVGLAPLTGVPVRLGYVGNKRYVRTVHAAPSALTFTNAIAILSLIARTNVVRTLTA